MVDLSPGAVVTVLNPDVVQGLWLKEGPPGPPGETGPQGPAGPEGAASTVPGPAGPAGEVTTAQLNTALSTNSTNDRARANHTGSQAISTVTGLQTALDDKMTDTLGGSEKVAALSATTGTATGDLSAASIFTVTPTGNITIAFSNVPATGTACTVTVIVTQGATVRTVTPPTGTKWMGAAAPTQVLNKACAFTFLTVNGGTTWYASGAVEQ